MKTKDAGRIVGCFPAPLGYSVVVWSGDGVEEIVPCLGFVLREYDFGGDYSMALVPMVLDDEINARLGAGIALLLPDGGVDLFRGERTFESVDAFRAWLASERAARDAT